MGAIGLARTAKRKVRALRLARPLHLHTSNYYFGIWLTRSVRRDPSPGLMARIGQAALVGILAAGLLGAGSFTFGAHAWAAVATEPSAAATLQVGVPFSGTFTDESAASYDHWWRLPGVMRDGDTVQLAVELGPGDYTFCLTPPTDDFGATNTKMTYCRYSIPLSSNQFGWYPFSEIKDRETLTYVGATGQGFLTIHQDDSGQHQYTATVERIVTRVNVGMSALSASGRQVSLTAFATYGDNTPVADGIPGQLIWRVQRKRNRDPFETLATASTVGGALSFSGILPSDTVGQRIELAACVAQPGGDEPRCSSQVFSVVAHDVSNNRKSSCARKRGRARRICRARKRANRRCRPKQGIARKRCKQRIIRRAVKKR